MTAMKQVAVQHRNNFIGTERVLAGIIAENNSATELLAARRVSGEELRRSVHARMSVGASQAADRIAWTAYSRKVIALAKERATVDKAPAIGCDHVLAGLVVLGRGVAADLLRGAEMDRQSLQFKRRSGRTSAPKRQPPPANRPCH